MGHDLESGRRRGADGGSGEARRAPRRRSRPHALRLIKQAIHAAATTTWTRSSTSSATRSASSATAPTSPKAWRRSSTSARPCSPARRGRDAQPEEIARASAEAMWADDNATPRARHGADRGRAGPRACGDDGAAGDGQRPRHVPRRLHLHCSPTAPSPSPATATTSAWWRSIAASPSSRPAQLGDALDGGSARACTARGRSGIYDVTVRDEAGATIAEFRGHSPRDSRLARRHGLSTCSI